MSSILIKKATIINENSREVSDLLIKNNRIEKVDKDINIESFNIYKNLA